MDSPHNPYHPPAAALDPSLQPGTSDPGQQGDLERALKGEIRLDLGRVMSTAMEQIRGMKGVTFAACMVLGLVYMVGLTAAWTASILLVASEVPSDIDSFSRVMLELSTKPAYGLVMGIISAPFNALLYLGLWNLGLRRAAGAPLSLADAFPLRAMVSTTLLMLMMASIGLLAFIHPFVTWIGMPLWLLVLWTMPLFLDREASIGQAIQWSVQLTRWNWLPMLGMLVIAFAVYMIGAMTCGIGYIWGAPFCVNLLGFAWRNLCGLQRSAQPA